jgi:hypothetical protein
MESQGGDAAKPTQSTSIEQKELTELDLLIRQLRLAKWLNVITAISAIVPIAGLWFVYLSLDAAREGAQIAESSNQINRTAMVEANRAWLSTDGAIIRELELGHNLRYFIKYRDIGKGPAFDQNMAFEDGYINTPADMDISNLQLKKRDMCTGLAPKRGGNVSFPPIGENTDVHTEDSRLIVDANTLNMKHMVFVRGCFAYRTMGNVGHTSFCYVFDVVPSDKSGFDAIAINCPSGNSVD